jgi:hypothetical protein
MHKVLKVFFFLDILGNCVFYQYLMQLSEYKYKPEFALGIIQSLDTIQQNI